MALERCHLSLSGRDPLLFGAGLSVRGPVVFWHSLEQKVSRIVAGADQLALEMAVWPRAESHFPGDGRVLGLDVPAR